MPSAAWLKAPPSRRSREPGDLPAQLPVGARPPAGSGEPGAAVPGLGGWCGPRSLNNHGPLTIDLDSTICETYGPAKEGARRHGYTGQRGYHPLLAVAAGTGDVLMARLRQGRANTARGAAHFLRETVSRVRYAGATGPLTVRADRGFYTRALVAVCRNMDVRFSITIRQHARLRNQIEAIPEADWTPIPYWMDGAADVAETSYTPFDTEPDAAPARLIVRRVQPAPDSQLALLADYSYHGCITDRDGETLELEADHRRHAEIENAIRDLKYGVGLNHLPSGRFAANAAWLAVQVMAHNLARWTARIGLGEQVVTTKTLRRRFFSLAGRLTRSARRLTLHLPQRWHWETQFTHALARLRAPTAPSLTAAFGVRPVHRTIQGLSRRFMPAQSASVASGIRPGRFRLLAPPRDAALPPAWPPRTTLNPICRNPAWSVRLPVPIIPRVNASTVSLRWIRG